MADKTATNTPPLSPTITAATSASTTTTNTMISRKSSGKRLSRKTTQRSTELDRRFGRNRPSEPETGFIYTQRIFKKTSENKKLTLYLASRDLVASGGKIDNLRGVLLIEPDFLQEKQKVFGRVTLTFRYGREDEEVMGLKFFNEATMALTQLYPPYHPDRQEPVTHFQDVLMKKFHPHAYPFTMPVAPMATPSVQLVPAKEYNGAPIGTSYDINVYTAEKADEKQTRKMQIIRMGIRVIQGPIIPPLPRNIIFGNELAAVTKPEKVPDEDDIKADDETPIPHKIVEKQFLLSDGRVRLEAGLDRAMYNQGETINVKVEVTNNSNKSVKKIEAELVQYVDVVMFSNGKFKNVIAQVTSREGCPVEPGFSLSRNYTLRLERGTTKNWIALEDDPGGAKADGNLSPTVFCSNSSSEDRNVFAIYVSYYVKVKITVSPIGEWIGNAVSLKLPFILMHNYPPTSSPPPTPSRILDKIETLDDDDSLPYIDKDSTSDEEEVIDDPNTDKENVANATVETNGDGLRLNLGEAPIQTIPVSTIAKLTTTSSIVEVATTKHRESMSNVDLIEFAEKETSKRST
ncbi:LOW QUALITY PROTEIN: phosrestin-2-like [Phymastichus coffea]|uniref:LOW QUALITY PROTEIN: phosrestin-2-like n=1 Tax=Phymastichus coffea TaxID=108790 RepID=UPI00273A954E|nr:LOW QUALITY PROTEIN: phosrestin-2-like [Phymastichus coffea]